MPLWVTHLIKPIAMRLKDIFPGLDPLAGNAYYGQELDRFEKDFEAVIARYQAIADERSRNASFSTGMTNVGTDMSTAISYANSSLNEVELLNDYKVNCQLMSEAIEMSREEYEQCYADHEGYGTGTLGQIAVDVRKLMDNQSSPN